MRFNDYMKASREHCFLTQEEAATSLGVSTTSVQKWEKDTLPDKSMWAQIIKVYKLDQQEFLTNYGESAIPRDDSEGEKDGTDFPTFLFPDEVLADVQALVLTREEQELLGLEALYQSNSYKVSSSFGLFSLVPHENSIGLPYEYVKSKGSFRVMALHDSLSRKLSDYRDYCIGQIKNNPDTVFNINNCTKDQILELCQCTSYSVGRQQKNLYETLAYDIEELRFIDESPSPMIVSRYNPRNRSVLGDKWENEKCYSSISKVSSCFLNIVEKESEAPEYIALKAQYEKDMEFYREHQNMIDHEPVKPLYNGYKIAVITDAGRRFLEWAADTQL